MIKIFKKYLPYFFTGSLSVSLYIALLIHSKTPRILLNTALADTATSYIQVASTKIRTQPKLWAPIVSDLSLGASVTVLSSDGSWAKVKGPSNKEGFLPVSALGTKKISLKGAVSEGSSGASKDDVVLAGKGLDKNFEEQFKKAGMKFNSAEVDKLEQIKISDGQLRSFAQTGKLG